MYVILLNLLIKHFYL